MAYLKLVVTGPFNAGKTALIRAVSEVRGVNTDVDTDQDRHVKPQTTVAMDFGKVTLANANAKLALVFMDMGRIAAEAKTILQEDILAETPAAT